MFPIKTDVPHFNENKKTPKAKFQRCAQSLKQQKALYKCASALHSPIYSYRPIISFFITKLFSLINY